MNCHKCGHPADNHLYGQFCVGGTDCMCRRSQHDVNVDEQLDGFSIRIEILSQELAAWKAEAMAAREVLNVMKGRVTFRHPTVEEEVDKLYQEYLVAKVVDTPPRSQ